MAAVDPYAPCPCGSGEKFKWCCQKVEAFAERSQRLFESGQIEAAESAVDEGLRKDPGNPWLSTRKAVYQLRQGNHHGAKATLRQVLARQPQHLGAATLLTRIVLETEGPEAGAAQFQQVFSAVAPERRPSLVPLARIVAGFLGDGGAPLAALAHLRLARQLDPSHETAAEVAARSITGAPALPVWQKCDYALAPAPAALSAAARERFEQALRWSDEGLWSAAAAAFEALSAEPASNPAADRNAGLNRLWLGDHAGAAAALARAISRMPENEEAVDLEALRQQIAPLRADDLVEQVQLIWPLRDRQALLRALEADLAVDAEGTAPIDPDDPNSAEIDRFGLLDRPAVKARPDLRIDEIPRFVGYVNVGQEIAALEAYDDGTLDALVERFRTLAGHSIAPAHPRTKVLAKVVKGQLALSWEWLLPEGLGEETVQRLNDEQAIKVFEDVWPRTPLPSLQGRTPLEAAAARNASVSLRAAVFQLEHSRHASQAKVDFGALRARLQIGAEPAIDPESVDIAQLHPARFLLVPLDRLSDEKLALVYRRAQHFALLGVVEEAARILVERPDSWQAVGLTPLGLFSDLSATAAARGAVDEAFDWAVRGRQAESPAQRAANAPHWDSLELRLKARALPPESWVPDIAVMMQRYERQPAAAEILLSALLDLGLVELQPNPDRPGEVMVDTRLLQAVIAEYGPRITTASGELGIAATRGGLWTPGAGAPGAAGGGLWTPGTEAPAPPSSGGPSKLIIPGR